MEPRPESPVDATPWKAGRSWSAVKIAITYLIISLVWIVGSDQVAKSLAGTLAENVTFQTMKGSLFVVATALLLWALIRREVRKLERVNRELGNSEGRLRRLLASAPVAILVLRGGVPDYLNEAALALLGPRARGRPLAELVAPDHRAAVEEALAAVRSAGGEGARRLAEVRVVSGDGRELVVEMACTPYAPGEDAVLVVAVDVTERKKLEAVMGQAKKLEAAGSIAALVTHEFNNVLTAILGQTAIARSVTRGNADAARALSEIESVGRHAAGLTRSLPLLQRQAPSIKSAVPVQEIIAGAEPLVRGVLPDSVRFTVDTSGAAGVFCDADPAQLRQALLNLAINARDAMPDGGSLTITALQERAGSSGRPRVVLRVTDTGHGIAAENLAKVFTPFFSTKAPGRGTGLGLAVTRGIVEDHGGTISVESAVGKGTVFTISIPAVAGPAAAKPNGHTPPAGGRMIVVGEDNPQVRHVFVEVLRRSGHQVIACADGESAYQAVVENGPRVSAVVLDVGLPVLSGVGCLERIRSRWPSLPCILTTGGPRPDLPKHLVDHTGFLAKPFSVDELIDTVDALVGVGTGENP